MVLFLFYYLIVRVLFLCVCVCVIPEGNNAFRRDGMAKEGILHTIFLFHPLDCWCLLHSK